MVMLALPPDALHAEHEMDLVEWAVHGTVVKDGVLIACDQKETLHAMTLNEGEPKGLSLRKHDSDCCLQ